MMRWIALPFVLAFAATLSAQETLPTNPEEPTDIEPPLLIQEAPNQNIVYTTPADPADKPAPDLDQLTASLEKAKKSAASGERLYKSGIIAKVEAESRALKVVRLEADLAEAKLELAKQNVEAQQARLEAGEIAASDVETAKLLEKGKGGTRCRRFESPSSAKAPRHGERPKVGGESGAGKSLRAPAKKLIGCQLTCRTGKGIRRVPCPRRWFVDRRSLLCAM
jgi:hypothetical protein